MTTGEYIDEWFCDNCQKDTQHKCIDSGHERDSSQDKKECLECHWYYSGLDGNYHEPFTTNP